jgi:hypothetical protein
LWRKTSANASRATWWFFRTFWKDVVLDPQPDPQPDRDEPDADNEGHAPAHPAILTHPDRPPGSQAAGQAKRRR